MFSLMKNKLEMKILRNIKMSLNSIDQINNSKCQGIKGTNYDKYKYKYIYIETRELFKLNLEYPYFNKGF